MPLRYPIILAHGIFPFDRLLHPFAAMDNHPDDRFHYFRKIRSHLVACGFTVFHSRVSWGGSLEKRAADLREQLVKLTSGFTLWPRVHIIAHSMGGLDARWMIYRYRMEDRVISLTTIGTPHHGSPYADICLRSIGRLIQIAMRVGLDLSGARDLTLEACAERNRLISDFEEQNGVTYRTIAGTQPLERIFAPLKPSWRAISRLEGKNDGLVSVPSASWKEKYLTEVIDADHLNQIGWWDPNEIGYSEGRESFEAGIRDTYLRIATGLCE